MKLKTVVAALALASLIVLPVQPKPMIISGQINHDRINSLTSKISWYQSLGQAETTAASQGKMIFWLHILGTISGET